MARPRVKWNGDAIERRYREKARKGIDKTLANCVAPAKSLTPVVTGTAQGSIQFRPAQVQRNRVVGQWGSYQVDYFIWLEIGAHGRAGHFMLRRTADVVYPTLARNIRQAA